MSLATILQADGTDPFTKGSSGPDSAPEQITTPGSPRKPSPFSGAGAGYTMVAAALLGLGLGYLIDAMNGTRPVWTISCFFLFLIAGTWQLIKEGRK